MAQAVHSMILVRPSALVGVQNCGGIRSGNELRVRAVERVLPTLLRAPGSDDRSRFGKHSQNQNQLKPSGLRRYAVVNSAMNDEASTSGSPIMYPGMYGPWSVDSTDIREVVLYRTGLVTAAASFVTVASTAFLPDGNPVKSVIQLVYDPLYALGASGLGLSLFLIHIYVTPIKRTLQLLWGVGVLGSLGMAVNFAAPADQGLVQFVVDHPAGVWAVGPLFAALTGLAFKEGLCYGKFEAAALFFVIPGLLLGHLSGVMDDNVKLGLLAAWIALFSVFAARKFTQPIKDDIGDKSVFIFNALPEEEKERVYQQMENKIKDQ